MLARPRWLQPRRLAKSALTVIGLLLLFALAINAWLISTTRARIYDRMDLLDEAEVALVLGTSAYTRSGAPNRLFRHRMLAAAELYASGKVQQLLISGANPGYYNEPQQMYKALRSYGVPHAAITLDFAGYSTFDSIVRSRRIFGLERYILVSQRYHDYRALFIARHNGVEAIAYVRPQEDLRQPFVTELREYLARIKAVLDLFILHPQPRYLGPELPLNALDDALAQAAMCRDNLRGPQQPLAGWRDYSLFFSGYEQATE
ncbi:MAG TPA: ElyC/SanA/YdcF family protein [Salinisphaeraceae bacterium]|nr:ElyC/SanA/YdcF family protein [Salinisphaeraceae bacterium]